MSIAADTGAAENVAPEKQEGGSPAPAHEAPVAREAQPNEVARFFQNTWAIARKELGIYFTTPIAYVLTSIFLVILSFFFVVAVMNYLMYSAQAQAIAQYNPQALDQLNFTDLIFSPVMGNGCVVLLFIVPFLTARLVAEEKRQQTFQLLMTSPLSSWQIVLGKYASALVLMLLTIGLTVTYPLLLNAVADGGGGVEWETAAVTYLGVFLFAGAFMSLGLFVSSLTDSQLVAGVVTFGIGLLMWVLSWAANVTEGFAKEVLKYVSLLTHTQTFLKGMVSLADVAYFLSLIVLGLFLTRTAIERSRW
jgi:ABC-2 type transport system permease protein